MSIIGDSVFEAWHSLARAHRLLLSRLDSELQDKHGLSLARFEALAHLEMAGEPLRMHELADLLVLSRSAATRFVDRLERDGLVRRRLCRDDRRGMELILTGRGRALLAEAAPTHRQTVERHLLSHLEPGELATVSGALRAVASQEVG